MMKKSSGLRLLAAGLCAAAVAVFAPVALAQTGNPPATHPYAQSRPVPGRYIVVFKDSVANPAAEAANAMRGLGGQVLRTYTSAIKGFAATLPDAALQSLRNNPNVNYIEQDQTVSLHETQLNPQQTQNDATWGLDRIDQADRPLDTQYHYNYTGAGVNAFIIDTGIRATHADFISRVNGGFTAINDGKGTDDCNGHGTHVAGTVGGTTWGVAKGVALIPVRVLDCKGSGTWSGVIAGIDWAASSTLRPAVANMSLGGGASQAVDDAVAGAVKQSVTVVVAAGNSNANACNYSPARAPGAVTVGATTSDDARASYSNYGSCLDIFAPGSAIKSAWNTDDSATNTISGTSMASPHVAGIAALALAANPAASPAAVASFLSTNATLNKISSAGTGSPNLLTYSLAAGAPAEAPMQVVAVKSLVGNSAKNGANWRAYATVTIRDIETSAVVANATVSGSFSPGGAASCVTASTGSCTMGSANISRFTGSTVMTVTDVSGTGLSYDARQNSATQITILKP